MPRSTVSKTSNLAFSAAVRSHFLAPQSQRTVPFDIRGLAKNPSTSDLYTRRSESAFRPVRTIVVWLLRARGWPSRAKRRGIHLEILRAFLHLPGSQIAPAGARVFHETQGHLP